MSEVPQPPPEVAQQKRELVDPTAISRRHDPVGRSATAGAILQARREARQVTTNIRVTEERSQETTQQITGLTEQERQKATDLTRREQSIRARLMKFAGIEDRTTNALRAELHSILAQRDSLATQTGTLETELQELRARETSIPSGRELLQAYYERMETRPLTNEEKRRLLTPEVLASLSTEEYIALWRRLNPYFLSHVTRQGFRDHNAMVYHSSGLHDFHNGFVGILEDGRQLRPPLALHGLRTRDEISVRGYLSSWVLEAETEEIAKERLNSLLNFSLATAPKYPDETAVHLAAQIVADHYYGGERGNEVFFLYPSDVLASQYNYAFNGNQKDFTRPQSETKWNDVFVWPPTTDNPGIPLDAGFVFLPKDTPIDPNTGSQYASEVRVIDGKEKRVMIEDTDLMNKYVTWATTSTAESPIQVAIREYKAERNYYVRQDLETACLSTIEEELQGMGFVPDAASHLADQYMRDLLRFEAVPEEVLQESLRATGGIWKRAQNTISSQDYWENYFTQHPEQRPAHIQYYEGRPTTAVHDFQRRNNIGRADTSESEGRLLGFEDHHITEMSEDPRANQGYEELMAMGSRIIDEHYKIHDE